MSLYVLILAGGLGTRLRSVVGDTPKCLATVGHMPFIMHLLTKIERELCYGDKPKVFISVGYKAQDVVNSYLKNRGISQLDVQFVIEEHQLGTSGAVKQFLTEVGPKMYDMDRLLILNGDTYISANYSTYTEWLATNSKKDALLVTTPRTQERQGGIFITKDHTLGGFTNASEQADAGIYVFNKSGIKALLTKCKLYRPLAETLTQLTEVCVLGSASANFLDIGTPEDYAKAAQVIIKNRLSPNK